MLENTDASRIANALVAARRAAGSPAMGMVLTLVIAVPEEDADEALAAAQEAAKEHPSRVLAVVLGTGARYVRHHRGDPGGQRHLR